MQHLCSAAKPWEVRPREVLDPIGEMGQLAIDHRVPKHPHASPDDLAGVDGYVVLVGARPDKPFNMITCDVRQARMDLRFSFACIIQQEPPMQAPFAIIHRVEGECVGNRLAGHHLHHVRVAISGRCRGSQKRDQFFRDFRRVAKREQASSCDRSGTGRCTHAPCVLQHGVSTRNPLLRKERKEIESNVGPS
jgi:hypothetical protein